MTIKLTESVADLTQVGGTWEIQILSEGVGSKGIYPYAVLERDGAAAFPAGTQIFMDHYNEEDSYNRNGQQHSIKDLVGVTTVDAVPYAENKSLRSKVRWFNGFESFVQDAAEHVGLSIEASGLQNEDGVVLSLIPSPLNAIAVVPRAGRDGKILSLVESYREKRGIIGDDTNGRKDKAVTPEDIKALVEALKEALAPSFTALTEALKPAPVEEPKEDEVDIAAIAEALAESDLPKISRTKVYEALKAGTKVEDAIEAQKTFIAELTESLKVEANGTLKTATDVDWKPGVSGWGL